MLSIRWMTSFLRSDAKMAECRCPSQKWQRVWKLGSTVMRRSVWVRQEGVPERASRMCLCSRREMGVWGGGGRLWFFSPAWLGPEMELVVELQLWHRAALQAALSRSISFIKRIKEQLTVASSVETSFSNSLCNRCNYVCCLYLRKRRKDSSDRSLAIFRARVQTLRIYELLLCQEFPEIVGFCPV